ncbi:uncharacterized protein [Neodiprion pinetum]|uniref:Uncharacterized protein LOC107218057 n=1 Tax=Neodiprion lecontei TaxID=441921 RepID=A0A6J0BAM6_NEOLC|nr:uncharacterized protein LOC107218057 [Neodiprion lecontei]XP_046488442.1 uncharacterized protein LOC124221982 [Neodiprion pinetum]
MRFPLAFLATFFNLAFAGSSAEYNESAENLSYNDTADTNYDVLSRERRTLVYPSSSDMLLIFGLGTPLQLQQESVIVGAFTKMLYALPDNSTYYTEPGVYYARSTKSRWSIYKILETASEVFGYGGKGCILRSICEAANVPFNANHGLFGELVHAFLTPSSTKEELDEYDDRDYHAAELQGHKDGDHCSELYPECKESILDIFTTIYH